jgi:LysM repeat protein
MFAHARFTPASLSARLLCAALIGAFSLSLLALPIGAAAAASCQPSYTVQPGDNLYRIGLKYGVAWPRLAEANNLANPRLIFPGQVLCIPAANATPAASTTPGTTATAVPTGQPQPTLAPGAVPAITIVSVTPGVTVTIQTANFPAHQMFEVRMGKNGTFGVNGTLVTQQDSGAGGSFTATYNIPASLKNERIIAIRLESQAGYFSYGWFAN